MKRHFPFTPALVLLFLSPMIAEMLTCSTPPVMFFNPFSLILQCLLYGGGAIIIRELTLKWGKGWPTILTLGAAYGIIEEGIMCKSFFDPKWPDVLTSTGLYGRWLDVNWVWTLNLIIYHSLISIASSIFLVMMLFPEQSETPWVTPRNFKTLTYLFATNMLFCFFFLNPPGRAFVYRPSIVHLLITVLCILALYKKAETLPKAFSSTYSGISKCPHPFWLGAVGFLSAVMLYAVTGILKSIQMPFIFALAIISLITALICRSVWNWAHTDRSWSRFHQTAIGVISISIVSLVIVLLTAAAIGKLKLNGLLVLPVGILIFAIDRKLWRLSRIVSSWSDLHSLALVIGALVLYAIFSLLFGLRVIPIAKNTTGCIADSFVFLIFFAGIYVKTRRRLSFTTI